MQEKNTLIKRCWFENVSMIIMLFKRKNLYTIVIIGENIEKVKVFDTLIYLKPTKSIDLCFIVNL